MSIQLTEELLGGIRDHGAETYPNECCGFLIGRSGEKGKHVLELWPVENDKEPESQRRRYLISPRIVWEMELRARREEVEILGIYHSHPDHPAEPSVYDQDHAWPWFSYIIVEVRGGEPKAPLSWTLLEDRSRFESEEIRIAAHAKND